MADGAEIQNNSWNEILNEVAGYPVTNAIDAVRRKYMKKLHELTRRNVIVYCSGWLQKGELAKRGASFGIDDNDKNGFMSAIYQLDHSLGLDLMLHTPGGSIGALESIVEYLKSIFGRNIRVIVPQLAMSAGTLLALASKQVIMGKQSSLGPIDPQINGVPAGAILDSIAAAHHDIQTNPSSAVIWQPLLAKYSPHLIIQANQAIKWAQTLARDWLNEGMFKHARDKTKAKASIDGIVNHLAIHNQTLSHDRHISVGRAEELGLRVYRLEKNQDLQDAVLRVHHSCMLAIAKTSCVKFIENHEGRGVFNQVNQPIQLAPMAMGN